MTLFVTNLISGLTLGCLYALIALPVATVNKGTRTLNFGQGQMAMFCAFITWALASAGVPLALAFAASIGCGFVMGTIAQTALMQPLARKPPQAKLLISIGLYLGINALAGVIWGLDPAAFPSIFPSASSDYLTIAGGRLYYADIGVMVLLLGVSLLLALLINGTSFGLRMRAVASNPDSARLCGIRVSRINAIVWGIAGATGAIAGAATASTSEVSTELMTSVFIYALAAVTLGGMDSLLGAVIGSVVIGIATEMIADYVTWVGQSLKQSLVLVLIAAVLFLRPAGLFGTRRVRRV